tara:strand:+ start:4842 stop:5819 length:978 start_codon:yes stop_codon:yes gene_type:complete
MDNQIVQPLRQYVVHIRSKDAEREGLLNSHLFIDLKEPITLDPNTEEIHQLILSGEIPYSFYNVSADVKNNEIVYDTDQLFTFPSKNYDIYELIDVITNDAGFPFSATYDRYTMKITLTNTSGSTQTIRWGLSSAAKVCGFSTDVDNDSVVVAGGTTISNNVVDLASIHSLFIKSNASSNMVFSTRAGFSQTIQKVSVDVNSGNIIYLNQNDSRQNTILHSNIDALDLRITDQNDNLVNFNNINYEISIGFLVYPINKTITQKEIAIQRTRGLTAGADARNRPFTPMNIIRTDEDIDNVENIESDMEHQNKRKIIDAVLERMGKT